LFICEGGERILISKQEGIVSEIRGSVVLSSEDEWVTLKTAGCRCHIHLTKPEVREAAFVTREKKDGTFAYAVEIYASGARLLLKIYFPSAEGEPPAVEYNRLKGRYGNGRKIVFPPL